MSETYILHNKTTTLNHIETKFSNSIVGNSFSPQSSATELANIDPVSNISCVVGLKVHQLDHQANPPIIPTRK